ncbi:amidohydrolase family protein [Chryseobacterium sp. Tr-659]|uniref:amidohydrolase n=1 Tax=Chryseobacterium sp. Tr-659 TaxID=2608340 RepID=UPI00142007B2|nr:amidohydrolase family protein [Chryseobacterium sp. Tr-659]NIF06666.1 amidohydrolase family protein [Chryseobacterium sp. Tr-659]
MENLHTHTHGCTHCSCDNPVLKILKEELFSAENLTKINPGSGKATHEKPQTLMISGENIRPMIGGSTEKVESIGIADGKVVVTGNKTDVKKYMSKNYPQFQKKQLTGTQTLLPGLIEPHVHMVPAAMTHGWKDVSPFEGQNLRPVYDLTSVGLIINKDIPSIPGYVILGKGLDPSLMPFEEINGKKELITINNTLLDGINADIPMMLLSASMHTLYLNTKALEYVFKHSTKIQDKYKTVEKYISDTQGQLQEGLQMTPALMAVKLQIIAMSLQINSNLTHLFKEANSRGITFMYDAGLNNGSEILLTKYFETHPELVRTGGAYLCSSQEEVDKLEPYAEPKNYKPVYYGHIKVVSDGSNQGLTGYQSAPYLCNPENNTGVFNFPQAGIPAHTIPPSYNTLIDTVVAKKGWPLMVHANGDQAVTFAINAYQRSLAQYRGPELRNRIEHCSLLTADQITNMLQMGVSPSFLIGHVGYWGYAFKKVIFGEKAEMLDLCGSTLAAGMRITLHSDNEVSPLGPLRMMEQSITRIMEKKTTSIEVLNSAEYLTPEQALIAVTYDAAWQCYADKWVGSLNEGYFADFVILEQDPLSLTTQSSQYMKMRNIPVLETWVGGIPVYVNDKAAKVITEKDTIFSGNS